MSEEIVLNRREGVVAAQDIHLNRSVYSGPYPLDLNEKHTIRSSAKISGDVRVHPILDENVDTVHHFKHVTANFSLKEVYHQKEIEELLVTGHSKLCVVSTVDLKEKYFQKDLGKSDVNVSHRLELVATWDLREKVKQVSTAQKDKMVKTKGKVDGQIKQNN